MEVVNETRLGVIGINASRLQNLSGMQFPASNVYLMIKHIACLVYAYSRLFPLKALT